MAKAKPPREDNLPKPQREDRFPSIEGKTTRIVLVIVTIAALLWLAWQLRVLLVDIVIAITLAAAIAPLANKLEAKRVPRFVTVLLTYGAITVFYAAVGYMLWPAIKEQGSLLIQHLPGYWDSSTGWINDQLMTWGLGPINFEVGEKDLQNWGKIALNRTLDVSMGALGALINIILVLFLTAYFVVNSKTMLAELLPWVPGEHRLQVSELLGPVANRMGGYVRGQALVSTAVATFFAIGLSLIGVKYALVLGLVAGLMNLIPYVGSMITTVLAFVVAVNQSPLTAALTVGVFALEQAVESNFIVPYLLGSQVELDPLIVLLAVLVGASLGGAVGALIAVPITSALILLARELYLKPMQAAE